MIGSFQAHMGISSMTFVETAVALSVSILVHASAPLPVDSIEASIRVAADSLPTLVATVDTIPPPEPSQSSELAPHLDSSRAEALLEEEFQDDIDALFDRVWADIDTSCWDTTRINGWHFESASWEDTARIVLVDSAQGKTYFHPCTGHITSDFGQRRYLWHYGIDIKLQRGDTVRVALPGIVRVIQYDRRGYGHVVVVRHPGGLETIYGHLSRKLVTPNQKVAAGEAIGLGGNTGRSTGSHLHFEMRYHGEPFDPKHCVDFDSCRLRSDTLILTRENFAYLVELRKRKWCVIRKGDTLGHIALRYGTTVGKLCALNRITRRTVLRIGRKLRYQ